ncbi:hypothetical protein [Paludisphaera mucosa]|uniref:Uncharacterized protein n=1 Tax=Paludisphaera mucosa TaxID=3030827 RepID=A0ABT6FD86_9BACT|nr:hypothetical protein [Paludisphaera mucosa]MDG3005320.1 hypothetical protein [Paludisphaera mucosa]
MTKSRRWWLTVVLIVLAAVAIEVGVRLARKPRAALLVINGGGTPVRDLVASYAGVRQLVGVVPSGGSTLVRLENGTKDDVTLAFVQEGNPAPGFLVGGEELDQARRDGLRVVVVLKPNEVSRYMEEDVEVDDPSPLIRMIRLGIARLRPDLPTFPNR